MQNGRPRHEQELAGLDDLFAGSLGGTPADELHELRAVLRRLPMLGPYNASLVHAQRPGARFVASRTRWREDFGRRLRPGARPLVILRPFGPVDLVYDVADTKGPPLPDGLREAYRVRGEVSADGLAHLVRRLAREGFEVRESAAEVPDGQGPDDQGPDDGGRERRELPVPADPRICPVRVADVGDGEGRRTVLHIPAGQDPVGRLLAIAHALAHALCHPERATGRPARRDVAALSEASREFESELVGWLIAGRLDITASAAEQLPGPADADGTMPPASVDAAVAACGRIETMAGGLETLARELSSAPAEGAHAAGPWQGVLFETRRADGGEDLPDQAGVGSSVSP